MTFPVSVVSAVECTFPSVNFTSKFHHAAIIKFFVRNLWPLEGNGEERSWCQKRESHILLTVFGLEAFDSDIFYYLHCAVTD